jgi:acyl carrier protein
MRDKSKNSAPDAIAVPTHAEIENILLKIWSEVLKTESACIHDDFFSLGGDSMAALRCINRINATFGVELPLDRFLLEAASIAQIAAELANCGRMQVALLRRSV